MTNLMMWHHPIAMRHSQIPHASMA
jgi:hypothetical protein